VARRPITKEFYEALLKAYREAPGQHRYAAVAAGCAFETARRGWARGWAQHGFSAIEQVLKDEHLALRAARQELTAEGLRESIIAKATSEAALEATAIREKAEAEAEALRVAAAKEAAELRALAESGLADAEGKLSGAELKLKEAEALALQKAAEAETAATARLAQAEQDAKRRMADLLDKAKVDAAETMADEAVGAKLGRKVAVTAVAVATETLQQGRALAARLKTLIEDKATVLTPLQIVRCLRELGHFAMAAERSVMLALQVERLRVGEPTEVAGLSMVEEATLEEEETWAEAALDSVRRAREKKEREGAGAESDGVPVQSTGNGAVH
jgi:hypothetical protein